MTARRASLPRLILLVMMAIPFLYPFFFLVTVAVRERDDYLANPTGLPEGFTLEHLSFAWDAGNLGRAMANSVIVSTISATVLCAISTLAAYWFLRHQSRGSRIVFVSLVSAWIIPFVIYLLPLFVILSDLGLTDNLFVLGLIYAGINAPFGLYLMDTYFRNGIPQEVRDGARVDGATVFQEFRHVILPLSRPMLGTLAALAFVWTWGDLLLALVLIQSEENWTLTMAAATLGKSGFLGSGGGSYVQQSAAAALIAILPLLVIFLIAQRAIMRGITSGIGK